MKDLLAYISDMDRRRAVAKALDTHPQYLWQMATGRRRIPAERVLALEAATGISRHKLRPDLYPRNSAA